jgi:plastocyanin
MLLPAMAAMAAMSWLAVGDAGSSAAPQATCAPEGTALSVVAYDDKYDKSCLAAPAGQAFTIDFDNQDRGIPHNVSIYDKANGNKELFKGEIINGPSKITYSVPAQAEGTYEFRCDPHPWMVGSFIVGNGGPAAAETTTTTAPPPTTTTTAGPLGALSDLLPN